MLDISKAVRIEKKERKSGGPRKTYIFKCEIPGCNEEIRCRVDSLKTHSGKCLSHSHKKRPFESIYNSLRNDHRKLEVHLTYDEYLEFTRISKCSYCVRPINWTEFAYTEGKFISRSYFLDRIDNKLGYSKDNCVVCCTRCNRSRGDYFTYDEWVRMTECFRI